MVNPKDFVKFVVEQHRTLSYIHRFSGSPRMFQESVAEHIYYVIFITMILTDHLKDKGVDIDIELALRIAIFHDLEETMSGDILSFLKQGDFKKILDDLNRKNMEFLKNEFSGVLSEEYFDVWKNGERKDSLEARVVYLADSICLLVYSIRESYCGNQFFSGNLHLFVSLLKKKFLGTIPHIDEIIFELVKYVEGFLCEDSKIMKEPGMIVHREVIDEWKKG